MIPFSRTPSAMFLILPSVRIVGIIPTLSAAIALEAFVFCCFKPAASGALIFASREVGGRGSIRWVVFAYFKWRKRYFDVVDEVYLCFCVEPLILFHQLLCCFYRLFFGETEIFVDIWWWRIVRRWWKDGIFRNKGKMSRAIAIGIRVPIRSFAESSTLGVNRDKLSAWM